MTLAGGQLRICFAKNLGISRNIAPGISRLFAILLSAAPSARGNFAKRGIPQNLAILGASLTVAIYAFAARSRFFPNRNPAATSNPEMPITIDVGSGVCTDGPGGGGGGSGSPRPPVPGGTNGSGGTAGTGLPIVGGK